MSDDDPVLLERRDGIARLTLNRPERLNAFTPLMHDALRAALTTIEGDGSLRCLVVTGAGRAFCSGQDLSARRTDPDAPPPDLGESLSTNYNPLIERLRALDMPIVSAVNGVAAGSGANLALSGDIVIARRSARFIQSFGRVGLIPDAGGTYWLPRLVGRARAMQLALLAEPLDAETAVEWGLIARCVDDDTFEAEVAALAERLANGPTFGYAMARRALDASFDNDLAAQLRLEAELQDRCGRSDDYREGVTAFLEKRTPEFRGR